MAWTLEDMEGGRIKVGNTVYNVVEIKYNGMVLWPMSSLYSISNVAVVYPSGNMINASGSIRASITGDVYYRGVRLVQGVNLTPTAVTGTGFSIEGNYIKGENRGTTVGPQRTGTVTAAYVEITESGTTTTVNWTGSVTVTQQANAVESTSSSSSIQYSGTLRTADGWEIDQGASADGDTTTLYADTTQRITIYYTTSVYTSGDSATTETSRTTVAMNFDNASLEITSAAQSWVHFGAYASDEGELYVDANSSDDPRTAVIYLYDEDHYEVVSAIAITQDAVEDPGGGDEPED